MIDSSVPPCLQSKNCLLEKNLDPDLHLAGAQHFAEWSFLLCEEKHAFCTYPFFMISSRFYEKNHWLTKTLDEEWENLFKYLEQYGWGFLPSYDRPFRWIDLQQAKRKKEKYGNNIFFPFTDKCFEVISSTYQIKTFKDYKYVPDLFCNYIGFRSRENLLEYVSFYKKLIHCFFDANLNLKVNLKDYIESSEGVLNNKPLKPFTFILEIFSHLFFYDNGCDYFSLHYNGYLQINSSKAKDKMLRRFKKSILLNCSRLMQWKWRQFKTENSLGLFIKKYLKNVES